VTPSTAQWRYALASVVGASHRTSSQPCQDASRCQVVRSRRDGPVLVAAVSDGAGSASHSQAGATLACTLFVDAVASHLASGGRLSLLDRPFLHAWLARFQDQVAARARDASLRTRDYACTFLGAVVGRSRATFCQVGDGAIVVGPDPYQCVFWPAQGEYANQTFFATDPAAAEHLAVQTLQARLEDVALLSDGLQRLALQVAARTAHSPFFRTVLAPVRAARPGHAAHLSAALATFLASPAVADRTDDDTTLVLATRRPAPPPIP
jgi:hypothetical protein